MSGWICSYRQIWEHPIFEGRGDRVAVWLWILHTAAWKDTTQDLRGKTIPIKRGQLCVSQRQIEQATGIGRQVIRQLISLLEATQTITHSPTTGATQSRMLITICNYDKYQAQEKQATQPPTQPPTTGQPLKEQDKQINNIPVGEADASADISIVKKMAWDAALRLLEQRGIQNGRSIVGRWLKSSTHIELIEAVDAAHTSGTLDPVPYITAALKGHSQPSAAELMKSIDLEGLQ